MTSNWSPVKGRSGRYHTLRSRGMKPSFLESYKGSTDADLLDSAAALSVQSAAAAKSARSENKALIKSAKSRGNKWKRRSGPNALVSLVGLGMLAGAAYGAWRWWQRRRGQPARHQQSQASASGPNKRQGEASSSGSGFTFDLPGKKRKGDPVLTQPQAFKQPHASHSRQGPKKAGNAKKDKALRKERKADKEAKKHAVREHVEVVEVADSRAEALGGKSEGPTRYSYVDFDKTSDAFQRVKDYEETGKKRFEA